MPASDYRGAEGSRLPFLSADECRQLEDDCSTFERYFRPNYDFRLFIATDIDAIRTFIRDKLNLAHWNQPSDNAGIARILKRAVWDGRIVPIVDRDRRTPARTERAPSAPQYWGATSRSDGGGGMGASSNGRSFRQLAMDWMGLDAEDARDYIDKYNAMVERIDAIQAASAAKRAAASSGGDLLGVATAVAGAMLGSEDAGGADDDMFSDDAGDTTTPLGNVQAFEYGADATIGDSFEVAKTPNLGDPGWYTNPGSGQMRLFGNDRKPIVDLDFDHIHNGLKPHAHNWGPGGRDSGDDVVPFSPWNP